MAGCRGERSQGQFPDAIVELDGWCYYPWIRKHWRRERDKADATIVNWFGPVDYKITACCHVLEDTAHILFLEGVALLVWFVFGASEAMVPEMRADWVAGASSLFLCYIQLQDSGWGIVPELCHLLSGLGYTHRYPTQLTRPLRENERVILNEADVRCHFRKYIDCNS